MANKKIQLKDKDGNNLYPALVKQCILDIVYPIGCVYISWTNTNPETLFGGTWEHISDGFLYCIGDTPKQGNLNGSTRSQETTLTVDQIPSHTHDIVVDKPGYDVGLALHGVNLIQQNSKYVDMNVARSTGGGQGHRHDIPYTGVMVWKRTA